MMTFWLIATVIFILIGISIDGCAGIALGLGLSLVLGLLLMFISLWGAMDAGTCEYREPANIERYC